MIEFFLIRKAIFRWLGKLGDFKGYLQIFQMYIVLAETIPLTLLKIILNTNSFRRIFFLIFFVIHPSANSQDPQGLRGESTAEECEALLTNRSVGAQAFLRLYDYWLTNRQNADGFTNDDWLLTSDLPTNPIVTPTTSFEITVKAGFDKILANLALQEWAFVKSKIFEIRKNKLDQNVAKDKAKEDTAHALRLTHANSIFLDRPDHKVANCTFHENNLFITCSGPNASHFYHLNDQGALKKIRLGPSETPNSFTKLVPFNHHVIVIKGENDSLRLSTHTINQQHFSSEILADSKLIAGPSPVVVTDSVYVFALTRGLIRYSQMTRPVVFEVKKNTLTAKRHDFWDYRDFTAAYPLVLKNHILFAAYTATTAEGSVHIFEKYADTGFNLRQTLPSKIFNRNAHWLVDSDNVFFVTNSEPNVIHLYLSKENKDFVQTAEIKSEHSVANSLSISRSEEKLIISYGTFENNLVIHTLNKDGVWLGEQIIQLDEKIRYEPILSTFEGTTFLAAVGVTKTLFFRLMPGENEFHFFDVLTNLQNMNTQPMWVQRQDSLQFLVAEDNELMFYNLKEKLKHER